MSASQGISVIPTKLLCYDGVGEEGSEVEEEEGDINKRNENVEKIEEKESGRE